MKDDLNIVGKRVVRSASLAKVMGSARYTADIKLPNMLTAKVLRSPYPRARIKRIDVKKPLKVSGVKAGRGGKGGTRTSDSPAYGPFQTCYGGPIYSCRTSDIA